MQQRIMPYGVFQDTRLGEGGLEEVGFVLFGGLPSSSSSSSSSCGNSILGIVTAEGNIGVGIN